MANLSNIITPTNVLTATSTNTVTNKAISGASNTITNVSLTTGVTGTLPVTNGGTGLASPGASGNVLTSNGTTWTSGTAPASPPYIKSITPWHIYRPQVGGSFPTGMFGKISDGSYVVAVQDSGAKIQVIQYANGTFTAGTQLTLTTYTASMCLVVMLTSTVGVVFFRDGFSNANLRAFTVSGNTITLTGTNVGSINTETRNLTRMSDSSFAVGGGNGNDILQYTVSGGQVSFTRNITNTFGTVQAVSMALISPTVFLVLAVFAGAFIVRSYLFNGTSWVQTTSINLSSTTGTGVLALSPNYSGNAYDIFAQQDSSAPSVRTLLGGLLVNASTAVITQPYSGRIRFLPANQASLSNASTWNSAAHIEDSIFKLNAEQTLVLSSANLSAPNNPNQLLGPSVYVLTNGTDSNFGSTPSALVPLGGSAVLGASARVCVVDYISDSQTLLVSGVTVNGQAGLAAFSLAGYF